MKNRYTGKVWAEEELAYLVKHYPIKNNAELAEKLGVSVHVVRHKAVQLGIGKHKEFYRRQGGKSRGCEGNYSAVKALIGQDPVSVAELIERTGLAKNIVRNCLERMYSAQEIRRTPDGKYADAHDDLVRQWLCRPWKKEKAVTGLTA